MRLYIDPGTGSMLFTILIGVLGAAVYAMRNLLVKVRFYLSAGKESRAAEDKADFAIFSDSKRYWNVFEPICDEFEKRGQSVVYMTSSPRRPRTREEIRERQMRVHRRGEQGLCQAQYVQGRRASLQHAGAGRLSVETLEGR